MFSGFRFGDLPKRRLRSTISTLILLHARVRDASSAFGRHHCHRAGAAVERSSRWSLSLRPFSDQSVRYLRGIQKHQPSAIRSAPAGRMFPTSVHALPAGPTTKARPRSPRASASRRKWEHGHADGTVVYPAACFLTIHDLSLRHAFLAKWKLSAPRGSVLVPSFHLFGKGHSEHFQKP